MRTLSVIGVLLAGSLTLSAQNLIRNGSFEEPQVGTGSGVFYTNMPGWTVDGEGIMEVQRLYEGENRNQKGTQWVELDVSSNTSIYQDVATVPGQLYLIRFRLANRSGSAISSVEILWDGAMISAAATSSTNFEKFSTETAATGTVSRLGFRAAGASDTLGDLIDDIELLPIPESGSTLGYTYYLAQFADGGVWDTTISFVGDVQTSVVYTAFESNGNQYLPLSGSLLLEPYTNTTAVGGGGADTKVGWIKVQSDQPIRVSAVYRQRVEGRPDQEAAVQAREPTSRVVVPFYQSTGFATGIAVAFPGASAVDWTVIARAPGLDNAIGKHGVFDPNTHYSFVLTTEFPEVAGLDGTLELTGVDENGVPATFVPLGLRAQDSGAFATLPY